MGKARKIERRLKIPTIQRFSHRKNQSKRKMVPLDGETSNELFEVFEDWGQLLNKTEITDLLNEEPEIGGPQP